MDQYDCEVVVIGAGVVGLACAAAFARRGAEVVVLESSSIIGSGTSSRNSEVVHAGIYYPNQSLKHRLCVSGRRRLYEYAAVRGVAHQKCGKLIVATDEIEASKLDGIQAQAERNEVEGLKRLTQRELATIEPDLSANSALLSSETGIIDSHGLMLALRGELEDFSGMIAFNTPFIGGELLSDGRVLVETAAPHPTQIRCRRLVNAAGLHAHSVAERLAGGPPAPAPLTLAKGSYFSYAAKTPFKRLIYPIPMDGGLGVHLTLDLGGRARFGPDVEWLDLGPDEVDYGVDLTRADGFYAAIRKYWPGLPDGSLLADYAGCRPKLSARGETAADFRIEGPAEHGSEGLVHLFGIESPGLTSALAISDLVVDKLA